MAAPKIEVISSPAGASEGPHWDHDEQALYFIDAFNSEIRKYDYSTKKETILKIEGKRVCFVVPVQGQKNKFVVGVDRSFAILTWDGVSRTPDSLKIIATVDDEEGKRVNNINDAKVDPTGRLWAGTMSPVIDTLSTMARTGSLYSLSKDGTVKAHESGIGCSNGLIWSLDQKYLYYIDSTPRTIDAFDFDAKLGKISNRRTILDFAKSGLEGYPDGMTIDADGNLWVGCYEGHQVICVDPLTGKLVRKIRMPVKHVTSVAFGGPKLDELFVTSVVTSEEEKKTHPSAGRVFHLTGIGARGLPGKAFIL